MYATSTPPTRHFSPTPPLHECVCLCPFSLLSSPLSAPLVTRNTRKYFSSSPEAHLDNSISIFVGRTVCQHRYLVWTSVIIRLLVLFPFSFNQRCLIGTNSWVVFKKMRIQVLLFTEYFHCNIQMVYGSHPLTRPPTYKCWGKWFKILRKEYGNSSIFDFVQRIK